MADPLDLFPMHHIRRPDLPWRSNDLTECGLSVGDRKVFSWGEARGLVNNGQSECPPMWCRTCWTTFAANGGLSPDEATGDKARVGALYRELTRSSYAQWSPLGLELRALGELVDRHREEFASILDAVRAERAIVRPRDMVDASEELRRARRKARERQ